MHFLPGVIQILKASFEQVDQFLADSGDSGFIILSSLHLSPWL